MEIFLQLSIGAIVMASELSLLAVGFGLIFYVTQTFHFAHGAVYLLGGYGAMAAANWFGIPLVLSAILGILAATGLGISIELFLYKPLRKIGAAQLSIFIASLGSLIILENIFEIIFGSEAVVIEDNIQVKIYSFGDVTFTNINCLTVALALFTCLAVVFYLRYSRSGRMIRAVANNPELAQAFGIISSRYFLLAYAIGSGLAGLAGFLHIIGGGMSPLMGGEAVLFGAILALLAGVGQIAGAALGALMLAFCMNFGVWKMPGQWQQTIAFAILFLVMIIKPEGVFGRKKT